MPANRIPDSTLARHPGATRPPSPHTAAELHRLLRMLRAAGADTIAIGHGRQCASVVAALALADAWSEHGGTMSAVVCWPQDAASWLRPARRLTGCHPDAWVIADTPAGCAQIARRLADQPGWTPERTFGFASMSSADLIRLAGPGALTGMTGATAGGGMWRIGHGVLIVDEP